VAKRLVGWTKNPLGTEVGLGPGNIVLDGDPAPSRKAAQQPPPNFSAYVYSIVAKRSPISATAELLFAQLTAESPYTLQRALKND